VDDIIKRGFNARNYRKPSDKARQRQRGSVREVDRDRVRVMAHTAVLVFVRLAVPVSCGLKTEGQHRDSHENG
jgi:hypothetical protein